MSFFLIVKEREFKMQKKKIIVDFDNTFTLEGYDLDDIIALLYLLTSENVEVPFVTTTFGNSSLENVNKCTENFLKLTGAKLKIISGNPLKLNLTKSEKIKYAETNKAAKEIINYIEKFPNEVSLLALGSLHNLADVFLLSPNTVKKIKSFTAMGGTTAPLIFNKTKMDELNFSVDYEASHLVLSNYPEPNIITGNNCIEHYYMIDNFNFAPKTKIINILHQPILRWLKFFEKEFDFKGNVLWDVIAAMYLVEENRFTNEVLSFELLPEQLKTGSLVQSENGTKLNLPKLKKDKNLYEKIFTQVSRFECF